jgi:hypothetical protein
LNTWKRFRDQICHILNAHNECENSSAKEDQNSFHQIQKAGNELHSNEENYDQNGVSCESTSKQNDEKVCSEPEIISVNENLVIDIEKENNTEVNSEEHNNEYQIQSNNKPIDEGINQPNAGTLQKKKDLMSTFEFIKRHEMPLIVIILIIVILMFIIEFFHILSKKLIESV